MMILVLWASLLTQALGAWLALKMFRAYGRHPVWLLVALGALAGAGRSYAAYFRFVPLRPAPSVAVVPHAEAAVLGLAVLLALALGVADGIFRARQRDEQALRGEKRRLAMLVDRRVADLEIEVAERKRAEEALRQDGERFSAIIATQHEIATADLDLPAMIELIVARAQALTRGTGATLQWADGDALVYRAASGRAAPFRGTRVARADGLAGECVRHGAALRCDDAERDPRVNLGLCRRTGTRSMVIVPLRYDRRVVGVLQATSPEPYAFSALDEHTLHLMAGLVAAALSHQAESDAKQELLAQKERLLAEATERADCDSLTGLLNHRVFHRRLEAEADRAQRTGERVALAVLDLDNFKFFNDAYGHLVGDEVLRQVAQSLRRHCRSYDTCARYGGDEFALILPDVGAESAGDIAARLGAALVGLEYRPPDGGSPIPLTLSVGVSVFPDDGPGRLEALETADIRLYQIKAGGAGAGDLTERLRGNLVCSMSSFSMLNALVTAVDAKDRYTRRHSEDVMAHALGIAQELGLDEEAQNGVLLAALLHDVGKIGVPNFILRKPGKLTDDEFRAIKQHPMMGAVIVGAVPGLEDTLDAIRHHHERWDGKGYPFGLRGEETPMVARLMAVADAFSAMTTDRPYRKGMEPSRALCLLQEGSGTQWDPACVSAFLRARRRVALDARPWEDVAVAA
jgi:diguanylate cyclase (GGDEF)-like protein